MIIQTWIFTEKASELFYNQNVDLLSSEQENAIKSSIKVLISISTQMKKEEENYQNSYSVGGLNIHIFFYNGFFFVLSLYTTEKAFIFNSLIEKCYELIKTYNFDTSQYSLSINLNFREKYNKLLEEMDKNILNREFIHKEISTDYIFKNKEEKINLKGKYLVVGLGSAGKSSIIAQTFENWTNDQIKKIKPTINKKQHNYSDEFIEDQIFITDLGGQDSYRIMHLRDKSNFKDVKALIFVVDILNPNLDPNVDYFNNIISNLLENEERPIVSLFFHKFDPEIKNELFLNLELHLSAFLDLINDPKFKNFDISYYLTSVFDNSAKDALVRTIFYSFPASFLTKTIQNNLVLKAANSLYPLLNDFEKELSSSDSQLVEKVLYRNSVPFGYEIAKITFDGWMNYLISDEQSPMTTFDKSTFVNIEVNKESKDIIVCLKCPLSETLKQFTSICEITHGIFQGLGNFLGYSNSSIIESEIRDNSDFCKIRLR